MVDFERSSSCLEENLSAARILSDSQRKNARQKALDLFEERLEWQSVPFRLMLEANRRCNVQCVHCDIVRANTGSLHPEILAKLMEEVGWGVMEIMPFAGGEPTLAPIELLARLARRHNTYLNFITNGFLFDRSYYRSIADVTARVHFSLHSHRKEVSERIMPGLAHETLVRNIADAAAIAAETGAQILCGAVVMDDNLEELDDYVRFVHSLGVRRVVLQKLYPWTKAYGAVGVGGRRAPEEVRLHVGRALEAALELGVFVETNVDEIFRDPRLEDPRDSPFRVLQENAAIVELFRPGFCISTAIMALVEWDGTVIPCCRDHIVLGNLHQQSFMDIWNGAQMRDLRASFFRRELRDYCKRCMGFYNGHS